ncbi:hypothetical protein NYR55_09290 [Sphingomonas sp. BGYR3]|uniref:hypothetical protein n=1 Tax=Sphingomonas sp. BGYR3 TaxID=2975483 RepID=UPI0021A63ACF|nr:hypothetical protein [Sphingomonas sp. BGYR3]MDG5488810.1 hypothetical protein [Sphingomonas sp. BGYR3]
MFNPGIVAHPDPCGAPDDPDVRLCFGEREDRSQRVIFAVTLRQRHRIEDMRLVRFVEDHACRNFKPQASLHPASFAAFEVRPETDIGVRPARASAHGLQVFADTQVNYGFWPSVTAPSL